MLFYDMLGMLFPRIDEEKNPMKMGPIEIVLIYSAKNDDHTYPAKLLK